MGQNPQDQFHVSVGFRDQLGFVRYDDAGVHHPDADVSPSQEDVEVFPQQECQMPNGTI